MVEIDIVFCVRWDVVSIWLIDTCVWCLMVGSKKWNNVQNESHGLKMRICVLGGASWGRSPQGERPIY